jgi:hypothetical protein
MHANLPSREHAPIGARLARAAARSLCQAAARLYRAAQAMERHEPPEDERHYARIVLATYGKLD